MGRMSAPASSTDRNPVPWSCPFCPLLCDTFGVDTSAGPWALVGSDCGRAQAGLSRFDNGLSTVRPQIDGIDCDAEKAVAAAARLLAASRQPLFGGLGTDVAGARALYVLACRTGAVCDPAAGAALWHGLAALQERGGFTTTLAEVRTRADLIVCIGGLPTERHPEFLRRCGFEGGTDIDSVDRNPDGDAARSVVLLQPAGHVPLEPIAPGIEVMSVDGDLFDITAMLAAQVAGRAVGDPLGPLAALGSRLHAARYAVLVYETARLPAHGSLIVEAINRVVATLNRRSRAAALPLGGGDGASTVNAVFTWLSGLPLRTRATANGLEHEPVRFDAQRLLDDRAVDALLWVASFGTEPKPPSVTLPRIVLGHPSFASAVRGPGTVYLPVTTPGIGSAGHLFRTDGSVLMPLRALHDDGLPGVADVLRRLSQALTGGTA